MVNKEINVRLEIVKMAISIGDHDTITIQNSYFKNLNNARINEICDLLLGKNYRQAQYLIKAYQKANSSDESIYFEESEDNERVLDIEDMLRMSPLSHDSVTEYKKSAYTEDDIESFAKNIEKPIKVEKETQEVKSFVEHIEDEHKKSKPKDKISIEEDSSKEIEYINSDAANAIDDASSETPLDEISSDMLSNKKEKINRKSTLLKYKTLREKFAKKEPSSENQELKKSSVAKSVLEKVKDITYSVSRDDKLADTSSDSSNIDNKIEVSAIKKIQEVNSLKESIEIKLSEEKQDKSEKAITNDTISKKYDKTINDHSLIYSPIPPIEHKFRQAFVLYPPIKESDIWLEEVVKFLKKISKNSFSEADVVSFLNEYNYYLKKNDLSKAAQILLLASRTILFWRGLLFALGIAIIVFIIYGKTSWKQFRKIGRKGVMLGAFFGLSTTCFVFSIQNTSIANALLIISTSPVFAALLSWTFLKEKTQFKTWITMFVIIAAMLMIMFDSYQGGGFLGDISALAAALLLAINFTITRQLKNINMVPAMAISGLATATIATIVIAWT